MSALGSQSSTDEVDPPAVWAMKVAGTCGGQTVAEVMLAAVGEVPAPEARSRSSNGKIQSLELRS